jgi:hypothetical protein
VLVVERNFTEFSGEVARDHFGKGHEPSVRVGRNGEATSKSSGAVSSAVPALENECVATVEGDCWLDAD